MGVVRDVTVDNLVTAVGNIDTSSLAQDSTLQDVATAIGNISGGSDPVTNTTVNTLCKDTTGQSIASAITALGSTLGSDKANIDGSNIANPSAFRSAINLKEAFVTEQHFLPNALTIPPDSGFNISINIAKSGYTPLAVASWSLEQRSATLIITGIRFNGSSVQILGKSYASADIIIPTACNVNILYIKN